MTRYRALAVLSVLVPLQFFGQGSKAKSDLPAPISMPANRAADSYRIYSSLMPLGETAGKDWPHTLWLVQELTITAVPIDQPCWQQPGAGGAQADFGMNPHVAIHPPDAQKQDFAEILDDFDKHCHERIALDTDAWDVGAPVQLLNEREQKEFQSTRMNSKDTTLAEKFKGAPALYAFSQVYFNAHHTVALVYATHWCGMLCGQGFWVAFELKDGKWTPLRWNSTTWIS